MSDEYGEESAAAAAQSAAEERNYGVSREDVQQYAAAAAGAAAAAVCGAYTGGALAPVCGWLASEAVGWLTGEIYDWFSDDAAEEAAAQRERTREMFASMAMAVGYDQALNTQFNQCVRDLQAFHAQLWPGQTWTEPGRLQADQLPAMMLLASNGLAGHLQSRPVLDANNADTGDTMVTLESLQTYWFELDSLGLSTDEKTDHLEPRTDEITDAINRSYLNAVLALGAQHLAEEVERRRGPHLRAIVRRPRVRAIELAVGEPVRVTTTLPASGVQGGPGLARPSGKTMQALAISRPPETPAEVQSWPWATGIMAGSAAVGAAAALLGVFIR